MLSFQMQLFLATKCHGIKSSHWQPFKGSDGTAQPVNGFGVAHVSRPEQGQPISALRVSPTEGMKLTLPVIKLQCLNLRRVHSERMGPSTVKKMSLHVQDMEGLLRCFRNMTYWDATHGEGQDRSFHCNQIVSSWQPFTLTGTYWTVT